MKKIAFFIILLFCNFKGVSQHPLVGKEFVFNSYADEQNPVLSLDGKTLFFIRSHHAQNVGYKIDKGDIWFSSFDSTSNKWSTPSNIGNPLNNIFYNGVIGFGLKDEMYLYNIYELGGARPKSIGISVVNPIKPPKRWSTPITSTIQYFHNLSNNYSISISEDKKIMVLSLESFITRGAEDLYVSFWIPQLKAWSEPKNLGTQINTKYQELTPFLAKDNKTLYFSSNGHGGFGSKDVFFATRLDETWTNWSKPKNMGAGINSEGAEIYYKYLSDKFLVMYTSTKNSDGYGDIHFKNVPVIEMAKTIGYEIKAPKGNLQIVPEPIKTDYFVQIIGSVTDIKTKKPILSTVKIIGKNFKKNKALITSFSFKLPAENEYILAIEADGYISKSVKLTINLKSKLEHNIALQPIEIGTKVKLDRVLFVRGTTNFLEESYEQLDLIVQMMKDNKTMEIELGGHTDNMGNTHLNKKLSQKRVNVVIKYFVDKGIDAKRLRGRGYGGSKPVAPNNNEKNRKLNRRVEFTVVKQ